CGNRNLCSTLLCPAPYTKRRDLLPKCATKLDAPYTQDSSVHWNPFAPPVASWPSPYDSKLSSNNGRPLLGGGDCPSTCNVTVSAAEQHTDATMIIALPAPRAVTRPMLFTLATEEFVLCQDSSAPLTTLPLPSRAVAWTCKVCPTAEKVCELGVAVTDATVCAGGGLLSSTRTVTLTVSPTPQHSAPT